jgi:cation transport ATPase
VGTIGVDAAGIALAAFGFLNPLIAAFIHVASELVFISNSARLLPAPVSRRIEGGRRRISTSASQST